jgi:hypothetical protein
MCYFATIAISSTASKNMVIPKRRGFHLFPYQNTHLTKALPIGLSTLAFTSGGCSCNICKSIGVDKISVSLSKDAVDFLKDISMSHGDLYFFIHWYSGDISTESLSPLSGPELSHDGIGPLSFLLDRITKIKKTDNTIHRAPVRRHAR